MRVCLPNPLASPRIEKKTKTIESIVKELFAILRVEKQCLDETII
jgi:hypothetical protein